MATYKEDLKKLAELCQICGGACCVGSSISVSAKEFESLSRLKSIEKGVTHSPFGAMTTISISKDQTCPSLGQMRGNPNELRCVLKGKMRPLSCRLFPLTFIIKDGEPEFYLSGFCPYAKDAAKLKSWIKKTIEGAREDLRTWTETEKLCRSHWHETHKNLIQLDKSL